MRVLITNDDGIFAPGLQALKDAAVEAGHEVYVAAPDGQRSAASHSITLGRALTACEVNLPGAVRAYAIDGTPADCVAVALDRLVPDAEVVLSGINHGYNGGMDVLYSGTVAAAMEGALMGRQALAVSLGAKRQDTYGKAAALAVRLMEDTRELVLPRYSILNLNYPETDEAIGVRMTCLRHAKFENFYVEETLPDGTVVYRADGSEAQVEVPEDDDYSWLSLGYATVSVMTHDMSNHAAIEGLKAHLAVLDKGWI